MQIPISLRKQRLWCCNRPFVSFCKMRIWKLFLRAWILSPTWNGPRVTCGPIACVCFPNAVPRGKMLVMISAECKQRSRSEGSCRRRGREERGGGGACEMSTGRAGRMGDAEGLGGVVGGGVRNMETESEEMRRGVKKDTNRENGWNAKSSARNDLSAGVKVFYGLNSEIASERKTRKRKLIRKSERKLFCSCRELASADITRDPRYFASRRCDYLCDRCCNIIFCVVF